MNDSITMTIESNDEIDLSITNATGTTNYQNLSNKPSINDITLVGNKTSEDLGIQDVITNENKLSSDLISGLANVATSGNYNDLSNKPTIPTNSDFTLNGLSEKSYTNLTDKPTIPIVPTNVSAFNNDAGYLTQHQDISGKLDTSKVKSTYSTTSGDVYDVSYINTMIGNIETLLSEV